MKRLSFVILVLFVAFLASNFNGCKKGGYVEISLNPADSVADVTPGSQYQVSVTLTPDIENKGEIGTFRILVNSDVVVDTNFATAEAVSYDFSYTVPQDAQVGSTITLTFEATDPVSTYVTTAEITLNVVEYIPEVVEASDITMHFISTDYAASTMMISFNADGYTLGNHELDGDLTFVYQATDYGNCILSPNNSYPDVYGDYNGQSYDYASKKQTIFVLDNTINFDSITPAEINHLTVDAAEAGQVASYGYGYDNVPVGSIFKFELADGRKGVLRVVNESSPNPGKGGDDLAIEADITIDVKYQATTANPAK